MLDIRVPEVMEAHSLASSVVQNPVQSLMHHGGTQRHIFFLRGWEQPFGVDPGFVFSEYIHDLRRKDQGADGSF